MDFNFEYEKYKIKINKNLLTGKIEVFVNSVEINRLKEKEKPFLIDKDLKMYIKSNGFDFVVPKVIINDKEILLAQKLKWFEILICLIPFPLLIIGGAVGGGLAGLGIILNLYFIRSGNNRFLNIIKIIINTSILFLLYFLIAFLLNYFIKKWFYFLLQLLSLSNFINDIAIFFEV